MCAFTISVGASYVLSEHSCKTGIPKSRLVERAIFAAFGVEEAKQPKRLKYLCEGCEKRCEEYPELLQCPRPGQLYPMPDWDEIAKQTAIDQAAFDAAFLANERAEQERQAEAEQRRKEAAAILESAPTK